MPGQDVSATETAPVRAHEVDSHANGAAPPPERPEQPRSGRRAQPAGRTTRVVLRRVDPLTVLRLSILYYLALFVMLLVAGILLWAGATTVGVIENVESFMEDIGWDEFRFVPSQILTGTALAGAVLVVCGTAANVLMTVLFNLISDAVGGLKLTLDEDRGRQPANDDA